MKGERTLTIESGSIFGMALELDPRELYERSWRRRDRSTPAYFAPGCAITTDTEESLLQVKSSQDSIWLKSKPRANLPECPGGQGKLPMHNSSHIIVGAYECFSSLTTPEIGVAVYPHSATSYPTSLLRLPLIEATPSSDTRRSRK